MLFLQPIISELSSTTDIRLKHPDSLTKTTGPFYCNWVAQLIAIGVAQLIAIGVAQLIANEWLSSLQSATKQILRKIADD